MNPQFSGDGTAKITSGKSCQTTNQQQQPPANWHQQVHVFIGGPTHPTDSAISDASTPAVQNGLQQINIYVGVPPNLNKPMTSDTNGSHPLQVNSLDQPTSSRDGSVASQLVNGSNQNDESPKADGADELKSTNMAQEGLDISVLSSGMQQRIKQRYSELQKSHVHAAYQKIYQQLVKEDQKLEQEDEDEDDDDEEDEE